MFGIGMSETVLFEIWLFMLDLLRFETVMFEIDLELVVVVVVADRPMFDKAS